MAYRLNKKLIIQKMDKETVLFDGDKSILYALNETAAYILGKLLSGWNKEKIITGLCRLYTIDSKQAAKDVSLFISGLKKKRILLP